MRKYTVILTLVLAACTSDVAGPADNFESLDLNAQLAYDPGGRSGAGEYLVGLHRLPDGLKLSAAQEARLKAVLEAHAAATKADREALAAIMQEAHNATRAGKSRAEIGAIIAKGTAIRARLDTAEANLKTAIEAVLTTEQKAWLTANAPIRCNRNTAPPLTDAQKTQIQGLVDAFESANKVDLDAIKAALVKARDAQRAGATRAQIAAILAAVEAAQKRVHANQTALTTAIQALLTTEQKASGCYGGLIGHLGHGRR